MAIERFVWIDQDRCTGMGDCADLLPDLFQINADGVAEVHEDGFVTHNEDGLNGRVLVGDENQDAYVAVDRCQGQVIYIDEIES